MTEPTQEELKKRYRLILNLGKHRVQERYGDTIKINLFGRSVITIKSAVLSRSDVAEGDILTIYTEIPYAHS